MFVPGSSGAVFFSSASGDALFLSGVWRCTVFVPEYGGTQCCFLLGSSGTVSCQGIKVLLPGSGGAISLLPGSNIAIFY